MPDHRHRGGTRDASAFQVPHRSPPEMVRDAPRHAGIAARLTPCFREALELASTLRPGEHPRNDDPGLLLLRLSRLPLLIEQRPELGRHRKCTAVEVLRRADLE